MSVRGCYVASLMCIVALLYGCSKATSTPTAPSENTFSTNISGTWSGSATVFGGTLNIRATLIQQTSSSSAAPTQAVTGTVRLVESNADISVTGTKTGNTWTVSGTVSGQNLTIKIDQTLTSASASSGTFSITTNSTGTTTLSMTKL